jgi:hypothetical protein
MSTPSVSSSLLRTTPHGITTHKTAFTMATAVRMNNPTRYLPNMGLSTVPSIFLIKTLCEFKKKKLILRLSHALGWDNF